MTLRHGPGSLPEESPRLRLAQSPACPYVGVQVTVVALQEEIAPASGCLHDASHTTRRTGALQTKVGLQQRLATFVAHGQRLQSIRKCNLQQERLVRAVVVRQSRVRRQWKPRRKSILKVPMSESIYN